MFIDSHAHLDDPRFAQDADEVIARARAAGVDRIITIGTTVESSRRAVEIAQRNRGVISAVVGISPHDARLASAQALAELEELTGLPEVVGVGETGLDYHYDLSPREEQRRAFEGQIEIALRAELPIVIHCREAFADAFEILDRYHGRGLRGVAHCFTGTVTEAEKLLAMGMMISISGIVSYASAEEVRAVAREIPPNMLLVETDCPYLTPRSHGRTRNEPAFVADVVAKLAEVRGMDAAEAGRLTAENAARLFGLAPPHRAFYA